MHGDAIVHSRQPFVLLLAREACLHEEAANRMCLLPRSTQIDR